MDNQLYDFSNLGISKYMEQMKKVMNSLGYIINNEAFKSSIGIATQTYIENQRIMQQYIQNNILSSSISSTLELYKIQMNRILGVLPTLNMNRLNDTLSAYKKIINEINFNSLIINNNGTIEYDGKIYEESEIEETSNEIIEEINSDEKINNGTILKKLLFSIIGTFLILFIQADDLNFLFLGLCSGFIGQAGADAYSFLKNKFIQLFKKDSNITDEYFDNYSGLVQIDNLKLRKNPNKDGLVLANLEFGNSIEITNKLGSWLEINYCIDEEKNTYISGWVYSNGIRRTKKIKKKLLS